MPCPLAKRAFAFGREINRAKKEKGEDQLDLQKLSECPYADECTLDKDGQCRRVDEAPIIIDLRTNPDKVTASHKGNDEVIGRIRAYGEINDIDFGTSK